MTVFFSLLYTKKNFEETILLFLWKQQLNVTIESIVLCYSLLQIDFKLYTSKCYKSNTIIIDVALIFLMLIVNGNTSA